MSGPRRGRLQLARLADDLSERDLAILRSVSHLRLASARQIERLHFPVPHVHASAVSAARTARRTLERLVRDRMLLRLERRIGGVRAGSASFVYAIGPVGERIVGLDGPRRRFREPSAMFVDHTLAVAELFTRLHEAAQNGLVELDAVQAEPHCWRQFSGLSGRSTLKPDLFVAVGSGGYELRWFVEVDRGTEHRPAILRKCRVYQSYYQSGQEQQRHGVFPRVLWVIPDSSRQRFIRRTIQRASDLTPELFVVTTDEAAVAVLAGGES